MPKKKEWKIDRFELGINQGKSERDLRPNELVEAVSADLDSPGLIKNQMILADHVAGSSTNTTTDTNADVYDGEGLFKFSSDYRFHGYDSSVTLSSNGATPALMKITGIDTDLFAGLSVGDSVTTAGFDAEHNVTANIAAKDGSSITINSAFLPGNSDMSGSLKLNNSLVISRAPSQYIAIFFNQSLDLYNETAGEWIGDYMQLIPETSGSFGVIPHAYIFDGAIRVGDKKSTSVNYIPNWIGWVDRRFWDTTAIAQTHKKWVIQHQKLNPPTELRVNSSYQHTSRYYLDNNSDNNLPADLSGGDYALSDGGIAVQLTAYKGAATSATTTGWEAKWFIAVSFVYEGDQESPLCYRTHDDADVNFIDTRQPYNSTTAGTTEIPKIEDVTVSLMIKSSPSNPIDIRIKGINVYAREDKADTWWQIAHFNTTSGGLKTGGDGDYQSWDEYPNTSTAGKVWSHTGQQESFPNNKTFEISSGYEASVTDINASYRTACVLGRNVYVGDVSMYNPDKDKVIDQGDVMVKTPRNKPDTFLWENVDIATTADGERIIHLEAFNDRILQFKENTLYILNVASDLSFIEETLHNRGISGQASVARSPMGISWVNVNGVYHYDGKQVVDLLEREGSRLITEEKWKTFIDSKTDPMIAYHPLKKLLIIKNSATAGSNADPTGSGYVFSFKTGGWVYNERSTVGSLINTSSPITNFISDHSDKLICASKTTSGNNKKIRIQEIGQHSDGPTGSSKFKIVTKDITFDSYAARKRIYSIYVTHRNVTASRIKLYYKRTDYTAGKDSGWTDLGFLSNSTQWIVQKFNVNQSQTVSLQLKLENVTSQNCGANMEIGDISIVYRENTLK